MELKTTLYAIERELGAGGGDTYRRHLTDDAVVVVPGQALTKDQTAEAMDASPGWDELAFDDEQIRELGPDTALLIYRFTGRRGDDVYRALMGSVYVRRDADWRMAFHQQTPLG
jgi:hypothetical protein